MILEVLSFVHRSTTLLAGVESLIKPHAPLGLVCLLFLSLYPPERPVRRSLVTKLFWTSLGKIIATTGFIVFILFCFPPFLGGLEERIWLGINKACVLINMKH